MTDQLHDLLTRIADQAGAGPNDPTLWDRARRARRTQRRQRAVAVVAAAAAVAALVGVGVYGIRETPPVPPVEEPDSGDGRPGIPSTVHGVPGDGGLDLETDLALGRASVAIANDTDAFVVTATDGVYHRLRLPGYDAASYDVGLPGLALSPDGRRLAYGWRSPAEHEDGRPRNAGLRVLDLETGSLWGEQFHRLERELAVSDLNVFPWDLRWSPGARYLGATVAIAGVGDTQNWYALLDTSTERVVQEFWRAGRWDEPPRPLMVSSEGRVAVVEAPDHLLTLDGFRKHTVIGRFAGLTSGRYSPDGRWLLVSSRELPGSVVLVDATGAEREIATTGLPEDRYPYGAAADIVAWTGADQALALLRPGSGPTTVDADADLALLTLDPSPAAALAERTRQDGIDVPVALDVEVVARVSVGDTGSWVSLASDLAVRDFAPPPFADALAAAAEPSEDEAEETSSGGAPTIALRTLLLGIAAVVLVGIALFLMSAARQRRRERLGAGHG